MMRTMVSLRSLLASAFLLISVGAFAAGNPEIGKQKSAACQACHGADGNGTAPQFPRLAGQYPDYLAQALTDYRSGNRKNPIMAPQAVNLSPRDIEDLAAYFSSLPGSLYTRPPANRFAQ